MEERFQSFKKGSIILRENDIANLAFLVIRGQVGVYLRKDNPGEIFPLGIVTPGELLGEMGIITDLPRTAEAIALTDVTLRRIERDSLEDELEKMPPWIRAMVHSLAQRLNHMDQLVRKNVNADPKLLEQFQPVLQNFAEPPLKKAI